jgi:23S rRNA (cytidine1920-2'-O)/16S rRNA (cytidine1409-2'-O)-methyltransferase
MGVSFISQTLIHNAISDVLCDGAIFVSLIKPQFELEKSKIGKGGIVKGAKLREDAVRRVISSARSCGLMPIGLIRSPIEGGDGNIEYLAVFQRTDGHIAAGIDEFDQTIKRICE